MDSKEVPLLPPVTANGPPPTRLPRCFRARHFVSVVLFALGFVLLRRAALEGAHFKKESTCDHVASQGTVYGPVRLDDDYYCVIADETTKEIQSVQLALERVTGMPNGTIYDPATGCFVHAASGFRACDRENKNQIDRYVYVGAASLLSAVIVFPWITE